ncbi:hypothetical protein [Roseomonas sp. CECT 9278]|uniref:hypothetical protein n=1 Tax=Roseomonas sp. CECT 9278 TaxID=2845823 RepID=UPI001E42EF82|nr:hypothetical protein [Roseomonas sp. CECT 9278]CAH0158612.1 hypothetical protein ROS9278_00906 [Roseomonas sp. CECT 9278]
MLASGEAIDGMTADDDARAIDRALDQCAFPAGYERRVEQTSALLAASSIRHEVSRPYRERRAAEATRRNIAQAEQRDAQVGEAGRRYLACVLEAAAALARASAEAAPVIAEAATAECPAEAGRLAGLDWQMKGAIDRAARPAVLARILRVRGGEGAP